MTTLRAMNLSDLLAGHADAVRRDDSFPQVPLQTYARLRAPRLGGPQPGPGHEPEQDPDAEVERGVCRCNRS